MPPGELVSTLLFCLLLGGKPLARSVRIPGPVIPTAGGWENQERRCTLGPWLPPPASVFEVPRYDIQDFLKMQEKVVMSPLKVHTVRKKWMNPDTSGKRSWKVMTPGALTKWMLFCFYTSPSPHSTCFFHNSIIEKAISSYKSSTKLPRPKALSSQTR